MTAAVSVDLSTPHAIFGVLLANELGRPVESIAATLGCETRFLSDLMDRARNGELPRVEGFAGLDWAVAEDAPQMEGEVLTRRWNRRVCRHLARHGRISTSQVLELVGDNVDAPYSLMVDLSRRLALLRIKLQVSRGDRTRAVWSVDEASADRLATLIASGWKKASIAKVPRSLVGA